MRGHDRLELASVHTFRKRIGGFDDFGDDLSLLTVGVNYYLTKAPDVAIGFDHETGRNPGNNFDDRVTSTVALKIKL